MPPLQSSRMHYVFWLSVGTYVPCLRSHYLKNQLMDYCQTWVMYVPCRANELIRFWGYKVKGLVLHANIACDRVILFQRNNEF